MSLPATRAQLVVLDTNVFIDLDEHETAPAAQTERAVRAMRYARELGYELAVADATLTDLRRGGEARRTRLQSVEGFLVLQTSPSDELAESAGFPKERSPNDECDLRILSVLSDSAVSWLLTNDQTLIKRAQRANLDKVVSIETFNATVGPSVDRQAELPGVREVDPAEIDLRSEIFETLEARYEEFATWWESQVVAQSRTTLIIGDANAPQGISVLKYRDESYGLGEGTAKLCTFKILEGGRRARRGELLLAASLDRLREAHVRQVFVELDIDLPLRKWLGRFGFRILDGVAAGNRDAVMIKQLVPDRSMRRLDPWEYHLRLGPGAARPTRAHLVPIRKNWHDRLFPSSREPTLGYGVFEEACGNAITKAYLSGAVRRSLEPGDLLVFVESGTGRQVSNLGVLEDSLVTSDPYEVLEFVSDRTVYTSADVRAMTDSGDVTVLRFRHDRHLLEPWSRGLPGYEDLIGPAPAQAIQPVRPEGITWLRNQLGV